MSNESPAEVQSTDADAGTEKRPSRRRGGNRRGAGRNGQANGQREPRSDDAPRGEANGNERGANDRNANDRGGSERNANDRGGSERNANDRGGSERGGRRRRRGSRDDQSQGRQDGRDDQTRGRQDDFDDRDRRGDEQPEEESPVASGLLEIHPNGFGFVRTAEMHMDPTDGDAFVPAEMIRSFDLRPGLHLSGPTRPGQSGGRGQRNGRNQNQNQNQRGRGRNGRNQNQRGRGNQNQQQNVGPRLKDVTEIEGQPAADYPERRLFEELTPVDPTRFLKLETTAERLTTRVIDLFCPIGKGTRGLIVAPPRSGKTVLLQHLAEGIAENHPECELFVLLVDERPEEVTEMRRTVKGTVYASSNDRETGSHVRLAEMVIERAKRIAEAGGDVVVLLDSITRLARAYNKHVSSGRTGSGGLDVRALDVPKRLFGAARAFDEGGSLTIMGTALVETNSRMDDVIFQEFKGTGNMELVLDRKLADKRVFPAINIAESGTRKEERLIPEERLERIHVLRRSLLQMRPEEAMEQLLRQMKKHDDNASFIEALSKFV